MTSTLQVTHLGSRPETPSSQTFVFELENRPYYLPGQYITLTLAGVEDPRGPQRPFTLSSSPTEGNQVTITMQQTGSPFKKALQDIANQQDDAEERIKLRGPMGSFTLDSERPAIMIAGGIGITPFRSMIRYLHDKKMEVPVVLLYSNRTPADIAFREELDAVARDNDWLRIVHTITRPGSPEQDWNGRTGRIDGELIACEAARLDDPVYYACGPTIMVTAMIGIVREELKIPQANVRFEKFTGY